MSIVVLVDVELAATIEALEPRVVGILLGRTPVLGSGEPTDYLLVVIQAIELAYISRVISCG